MSLSNPHFHIMCPIRSIEPDSRWGNKQRREYVLDEHDERVLDEAGTMCSTPFQRRIGAGQNENIEKFIQKAHKYVGVEDLDGYALCKLVPAIYVDAPDKPSGKRVQHIHIKRDGLGFISLNELMKKETA